MAGSAKTGDDLVAGHNNGSNDTTFIFGERKEGDAQHHFTGSEVFVARPLPTPSGPPDAEDFEDRSPDHAIDGILGIGWNGNLNLPRFNSSVLPMDQARGIIGQGGLNGGTGVEGQGSGLAKGGIGVRGIGGPVSEFGFGPVGVPGIGVLAQGGRANESNNRARQFHAAGVVGIAGGKGENPATNPPIPPPSVTGNVGVYGLGGSAETLTVSAVSGSGTVPSGAPFPGPGVVGQGGLSDATTAARPGTGVVGVAGDAAVPSLSTSGGVGVWGEGLSGEGLHGHSRSNRGAIFASDRVAQIHLMPLQQATEQPSLLKDGLVGDLLLIRNTAMNVDGQVIDRCSLWLCVPRVPKSNISNLWQPVLLGPTVTGTA